MRLERHPRGIAVVVTPGDRRRSASLLGTRPPVAEFTASSRRRLAWRYSQGPWVGMLTLTYHCAGTEIPSRSDSKRHLDTFLKWLRRRGLRYLWILEFQRRGVPHYHVWVSKDVTDKICHDRLTRGFDWRSCMRHWLRVIGSLDDQSAFRVAMHPASYQPWDVRVGNNYATKYADKICQKGLPESVDGYGRWWGTDRQAESDLTAHWNETTETVRARRQCIRYFERTMPSLRRAHYRPQFGFKRALTDQRLYDIERILMFYLGDNLWSGSSGLDIPDQLSYGARCAMSQARYLGGSCPGAGPRG